MKFLSIAALLLLAACGHKDDAPAVATAAASTTSPVVTNNFQGGTCGDQVTQDYLTLRDLCAGSVSQGPRDSGAEGWGGPGDRGPSHHDSRSCRGSAGDFLRSYPQVSCAITLQDPLTGQPRVKQIDERVIRNLVDRADPRPDPRR